MLKDILAPEDIQNYNCVKRYPYDREIVRDNELHLFGLELGEFIEKASPHIDETSTDAMRHALKIAKELYGAYFSINGNLILTRATNNLPPTKNQSSEFIFTKISGTDNKSHFGIYPVEFQEEWHRFGNQLANVYAMVMNSPFSNTRHSATLLTPLAPYWVASFGPLRIITPKSEQLLRTGIGYHPEHEQFHTNLQAKYPELYFGLLGKIPLIDEAFAILHNIEAFRKNLLYYMKQNILPDWCDIDEVTRQTRFVSSKIDGYFVLPVGNEERRLKFFTGDSLPGVSWFPEYWLQDIGEKARANDIPEGLMLSYTDYVYEQLNADKLSLLGFSELMGKEFNSARYPQFMCFALFLEELLPSLSSNLRTISDELRDKDITIEDNFKDPKHITAWIKKSYLGYFSRIPAGVSATVFYAYFIAELH